ncbi:Monocarboxylate transporter 13 [Oryzias melastigma]|uniref:Monocarboxylate transporter 13 n=1 Tax=Oryzias melastigma TaxID=30732 RepID=A0A834BLH4_ORYME|nr:Monocarboxylate transporter 13 [Oryzias melastigma]
MTKLKQKAEGQSDGGEDSPDGGWGWVLVVAMFVSMSLVFGLMRSLGIFFMEFVQYFEESAQAISWISSIGLAAQQFFSPLGAALCNAFNARVVVMTGGLLAGLGLILASQATCLVHLYLTMGLISGLGWGLIFTPMIATVIANFTHRRTLAIGLGFSSIGLSSFAFNPLFQLLVETYAWRGALLILGGMSLNIVPCGALIRPKPRPKAPQKDSKSKLSCADVLRRFSSYLELSLLLERPYITYTLAISLFNVGYFVPYFHLVAHSRQAGFSQYQAAFVVSAAGATDICGRVVSGWFSDLGHFRLIHLLSWWTLLVGLFIMLLPCEFPDGVLRRSGGDQPPVRVLLRGFDLSGIRGGAEDRRCAEDDGRPRTAAAHREQCRTAGNPSVRLPQRHHWKLRRLLLGCRLLPAPRFPHPRHPA